MFTVIFAIAIAGFVSVLFIHGGNFKDPRASAGWSKAVGLSLRTGFLFGALVYLYFFSIMPTGEGPGTFMLVMGGLFAGPMLGTLAGVIMLPVYYWWFVRKVPQTVAERTGENAAEPAPTAPALPSWNPYFPGLVFVLIGIFKIKDISYHGHRLAWGTFFLLLGGGACLGPFLKSRGKTVHWAAPLALGALLGWAGYSAMAGIGPVGLIRRRALEKETLASLADFRAKLDAFAKDNDGRYPEDLMMDTKLYDSGFFSKAPTRLLPHHNDTTSFRMVGDKQGKRASGGSVWGADDIHIKGFEYSSGWAYYSGPGKPRFYIWCVHTDSKGTLWSMY